MRSWLRHSLTPLPEHLLYIKCRTGTAAVVGAFSPRSLATELAGRGGQSEQRDLAVPL